MMLATLLALAVAGTALAGPMTQGSLNYTTVTGYFQQDDAATDPSTFDYVRGAYGFRIPAC